MLVPAPCLYVVVDLKFPAQLLFCTAVASARGGRAERPWRVHCFDCTRVAAGDVCTPYRLWVWAHRVLHSVWPFKEMKAASKSLSVSPPLFLITYTLCL